MADRWLTADEDLTPFTLRDAVTRTLPHGAFQIDPMPQHGPEVLRITCRCGRCLRWVGQLPSDVLLWWLADHDDEMFLTPAEVERRHGAQIPEHLDMSRLALPPADAMPDEEYRRRVRSLAVKRLGVIPPDLGDRTWRIDG